MTVLPFPSPPEDDRPRPAAEWNPRGRGVLDGAFAVLEALGAAEDGLGLSALARATGLPKSSVHRLAEQLVELDAVQRVERRYYVGRAMARIGNRWLADPVVHRLARNRLRALASRSRGAAQLVRLQGGETFRVVSAAVGEMRWLDGFERLDSGMTGRTAAGRVLHAVRPSGPALPDCWSPREWQRMRSTIRDPRATVADHQDAFPGLSCVAAPVWSRDGVCLGAVTAVVPATAPPRFLTDLVVTTARQLGDAVAR
ncbi:helix-turn-helix domain-containing protein [Nocardia yamanashiensis]|uniref:IclR family transcriptional regulator n=1 Tax=Nocardia yamanashiensis TaxID=209247 RepID=UPI001E2E59DB|nr:helix-turn-helix domain-containing protein [Nocardia yamanashiensis]UGT40898.1 helix-turn-helix domain-containing protein [Nocardia yamanashiensis]